MFRDHALEHDHGTSLPCSGPGRGRNSASPLNNQRLTPRKPHPWDIDVPALDASEAGRDCGVASYLARLARAIPQWQKTAVLWLPRPAHEIPGKHHTRRLDGGGTHSGMISI